MFVKAGAKYYYNQVSGAVYPWSPDLEAVKGLKMFTAAADGPFDVNAMDGPAEGKPTEVKAKAPRAKTVKYVAEAPVLSTVEVPTASGTATIPAVNLTMSDIDLE